MIDKFCELLKKHRDILAYLVFGVLTTLVNFIIYTLLFKLLHMSAAASNGIAWAVAVAFAFLTNKPFVFQSLDWSRATVLPELAKFVGCRVGSGLLETGFLALTVDLLGWNGIWMKAIAAVFVVILNYIGSKLLVFKK